MADLIFISLKWLRQSISSGGGLSVCFFFPFHTIYILSVMYLKNQHVSKYKKRETNVSKN